MLDKFQIPGADEIAECRVSVDALDLTGHVAKGWIFADPADMTIGSATFTYVPERDGYDVTANPYLPWRDEHSLDGAAYNLAAAVRIVQHWVQKHRQAKAAA